MYKLILLDADNTIFDYDRAEEYALFESFKKYGITGDYVKIRETYRGINSKLWKMLEDKLITKVKLKSERFSQLFEVYGYDIDPVSFSGYYLLKLGEGNFLLDGAVELCRYLANKYKVVILTNGIQSVQESRINSSEISQYIDDIVTSDEVGVNKPDKHIFQWTFDKLGYTDKDSTIIIGDSLTSDIKGGLNFGIDTCWFNFDQIENQTDIIPKYKIDKLSELYELL
ncbi:MAG: YjjG family noncanonical pyrimidine nucleotidase [Spirochaetaceae bacterium]